MNTLSLVLVIVGGVLQLGGLGFTVWQVAKHFDSVRAALPAWVIRALRLRQSAVVHAPPITATVSLSGVAVVVGESDIDRIGREVADLERRVGVLREELGAHGKRLDQAIGSVTELDRKLAHDGKMDARYAVWGVAVVGMGIILQTVGSVLPMLAA